MTRKASQPSSSAITVRLLMRSLRPYLAVVLGSLLASADFPSRDHLPINRQAVPPSSLRETLPENVPFQVYIGEYKRDGMPALQAGAFHRVASRTNQSRQNDA